MSPALRGNGEQLLGQTVEGKAAAALIAAIFFPSTQPSSALPRLPCLQNPGSPGLVLSHI